MNDLDQLKTIDERIAEAEGVMRTIDILVKDGYLKI